MPTAHLHATNVRQQRRSQPTVKPAVSHVKLANIRTLMVFHCVPVVQQANSPTQLVRSYALIVRVVISRMLVDRQSVRHVVPARLSHWVDRVSVLIAVSVLITTPVVKSHVQHVHLVRSPTLQVPFNVLSVLPERSTPRLDNQAVCHVELVCL
jgi:hypothetical protein